MKSRQIIFALSMMFNVALASQLHAQTGTPSQPAAPEATQAAEEPIGNVATVQGTATVTRNNTINALKVEDDIYKNDVLVTAANSSLGITFNDETTFSLTANSRIIVDNFVYEEGAKTNAALFNVARGTVAFVASAVAKTGDMKISTPTATLGIRGTTGLVEVPENATTTNASNIKLYPDADGKVGRIEITGRDGARLGLLSQGASGFAIRAGIGGRFAATPLQISPQQAARDQGFVRQVFAAQTSGRRIVQQQRTLRQQNNPQRNPQRQNGLQKQNGPQKQQPGLQKQNGLQKQQPGLTKQPGLQKQTGPQSPQPPGLQRPGQRGPAALPKPNRPAPSGEKRGRKF